MKLDYNCIRDVLLVLEENLVLDDNLEFNSLNLNDLMSFDILKQYTKSNIAYSIINLEEVGFIEARISHADGGIYYIDVSDITYIGHEFLSSIRPTPIWNKLLNHAKALGTLSIPIIQEISTHLISTSFYPPS